MGLGTASAVPAAVVEVIFEGLPLFTLPGIVNTGSSAIGFALLENIIYVARLGLGAGAARMFSAVPLHMFTAVLVGLHVGRARFIASRPARTGLVLRGWALAQLVLSGNVPALLLLAASALFWILFVAGLWFTEAEAEPGSAVLGGNMLTVIPVSLGVIVEATWQKRRWLSRGTPGKA